MAMLTVEGVFESGRIRLSDNVALPDHTKVYVVIPDVEAKPLTYCGNPRLVRPEQASDFAKQMGVSLKLTERRGWSGLLQVCAGRPVTMCHP